MLGSFGPKVITRRSGYGTAGDYNVTLQSSVTFTSPGGVSRGSRGVSPHGTPARVRSWALREWRSLAPIYIDSLTSENSELALLKGNLDFVRTSQDSQAMPELRECSRSSHRRA